MQKLCELTGLSSHLLHLLYDFNPHRFTEAAAGQQLLAVVCHNPQIHCFHKTQLTTAGATGEKAGKSAQRKQVVQAREQALEARRKTGELSAEAKDAQLVHEFCGWAHTDGGHFVYVYYVGPVQRSPQDLATLAHWVPIDKHHLGLFHKRLGKNVARFYDAVDVTETEHGSDRLAIDLRFVANKWLASQQGEKLMPLLRENGHLLARGEDYLAKRHQQQQQVPPTPKRKHATMATELAFDDGNDPYEVRDPELRHMTDAEWDRMQEVALPETVRCDFTQFLDMSRRAARRDVPPDEYERDPIHLIDALLIACNLQLHCLSTAALVTREHIQIVENDDRTRLIDSLSQDPACVSDIQARSLEFFCACMAVEHASRDPVVPAPILEKLAVVK